jgi:transcription-repair coupling factor (superfamily II helicase)
MVELVDRFGKVPIEVSNLLISIRLKILCKMVMVEKLDVGPKGIVITFKENNKLQLHNLLDYICKNPLYVKMRPDNKIVFAKEHSDISKRTDFAFECIRKLILLLEIK